MSESDKPFACTVSGCSMRFTNEDHLTVHRKKHEMSLHLPGNGNKLQFFADQTPTPTQFLRNCDEVALFQDLQTVNPFEETFRKVNESGKLSVSDAVLSSGEHDVLHTPLILPSSLAAPIAAQTPMCSLEVELPPPVGHQDVEVSTDRTAGIHIVNDSIRTDDTVIDKTVEDDDDVIILSDDNIHSTTSSVTNPVQTPVTSSATFQIVLQLPNGQSIPVSLPAIPMPVVLPAGSIATNNATTKVVQASQTKSSNFIPIVKKPGTSPKVGVSALQAAKQKLKETITQNLSSSNVLKSAVTSSDILSPPSSSREKTQMALIQGEWGNSNDSSGSEHNPNLDDRRKKFLERNRAAAIRCRQRRKQWISSLEQQVNEYSAINQQLQTEVGSLRSEVAKLKSMLLAHRDCPVTQQQLQESGMEEPTNSTAVPVQVIPVEFSNSLSLLTGRSTDAKSKPEIPVTSTINLSSQGLLTKYIPIVSRTTSSQQPTIILINSSTRKPSSSTISTGNLVTMHPVTLPTTDCDLVSIDESNSQDEMIVPDIGH